MLYVRAHIHTKSHMYIYVQSTQVKSNQKKKKKLKLSFCRWVLLSHDTHPTIESFWSVWPATNLTNTQNSKPTGDTLGQVMQIVGHSYFRLCLFWVKITFGNTFLYLRVFGYAWKMHFSKMVFSWPCVGCKLISVFILPSNTIFRKIERERAEWEWDRGRRERERAHPSGQTSSGQRDRT